MRGMGAPARPGGRARSILFVLGTRPEGVKLAPVIRRMRRDRRFRTRVILTGQHRELMQDVLPFFGIRPDEDLGVMEARQDPGLVTRRILERLPPRLRAIRPDWVVVEGDTTSVFASAYAARLEGIPVAHVEAGLRTSDPRTPFPEEMNRRLVSRLASLHLAPTRLAARNLLREGIPRAAVRVTGNPVVDALRWALRHAPRALPEGTWGRVPVLLLTCHRRESFGAPIRRIFSAVREIARHRPGILVAFPVHPNPEVAGPARRVLGSLRNVRLLPPQPYPAMVVLLARSRIVLTDSGGLQEEAPSLGRPVVVLREETERPEAVEAGAAVLAGSDPRRIARSVSRLLDDPRAYARAAKPRCLFGDGRAARRIAAALRDAPR